MKLKDLNHKVFERFPDQLNPQIGRILEIYSKIKAVRKNVAEIFKMVEALERKAIDRLTCRNGDYVISEPTFLNIILGRMIP